MKDIFQSVYDLLKAGESIVLASVVAQTGSTPRGTGAKMIVRKNKEIIGTIGGGALEREVQNSAVHIFGSKESVVREFTLTEADIAKLGMICGGSGSITVYLQYIDASHLDNINICKNILEVYENGSEAWLITSILEKEKKFKQFIYVNNNENSQIAPTIKEKLEGALNNQNVYLTIEDEKFYIEPLSKVSKAFIFGGGHVGLEIAIVLSRLGFYITVLDDREEFANKNRFPMADKVHCADMIQDAFFQSLNIDKNSYVIIVTRGHMYDGEVLAQALKTEAAYIGMIGSRGKRDKIYQRLLEKGYSASDIEKVYSPIGLPIKAETPAEIAISIAGEIIKARAENNG